MDTVNRLTIGRILFLVITFGVYSASSIFSKVASMQEPMSLSYFLCLGGVVSALGVYAILWQKVLSFMPLNKSFLFKSMTIIIILTASVLVFNETVTINNLIGAGFILAGLIVLSWKD